MGSEAPNLIWVDCEMTGLDLEKDLLVEIAVLVTDSQLNILGEGVDLVIHAPQDALDGMNDFVREMHTSSGLITEIPEGVSLSEAETIILEYLNKYAPGAGKSPLAGNSVSVDRTFISRFLPEVNNYLHYRTVDVSSVKELARRWYPKVYYAAPKKTGNHRALGDIRDSIEELEQGPIAKDVLSQEPALSEMIFDVMIEIPAGSRNKYEVDHRTGEIRLDRMLFTATRFPHDYGYVKNTLSLDGDPLDALVMLDEPTFPGCIVSSGDIRKNGIRDITDVASYELDEIKHFFEVYKTLEPGKQVHGGDWVDHAAAE
eukprot:gene9851-9917_t